MGEAVWNVQLPWSQLTPPAGQPIRPGSAASSMVCGKISLFDN
jgi:hypothetical protein